MNLNEEQIDKNKPVSKSLQPFFYSLVLIAGILLGVKLASTISSNHTRLFSNSNQNNKVNELLNYIQQNYVDTISKQRLVDETVTAMLQTLDPHSAYIPASELTFSNEMLQGNFEGIGIEFNILNDTIYVVSVISGGPSEIAGLKAGDRIVAVENKSVASKRISNNDVLGLLRGKGGSVVHVSIIRRNIKEVLKFAITRGKIPLHSIDAAFMLDNKTGYIKIGRFAQTTYDEYKEAFEKLTKEGLNQLIIDLRENPGGLLNITSQLCDEFLDDEKLIVFTQGQARKRENFYATSIGSFEKNKLAIIIDEGSASASEILAGAIQDNDRGIIVGRRSFGKGLVQEQSDFSDGSAVRLTIARYYTPTGRCIQKPYKPGQIEDYQMDEIHRYRSGELGNKDSIKFSDSLKFKTPKGKIVYGGGGIMPDIYVPIDTTHNSLYLTQLYVSGTINQFAVNYSDQHRTELLKFKSVDEFIQHFSFSDQLMNEFIEFATKQKIKKSEYEYSKSLTIIKQQLKAYIARNVWHDDAFFKVVAKDDKMINAALKAIN